MRVQLPHRVRLVEVGPRDGLQNIATAVDDDVKVRFVEALVVAGLAVVEVGGFVSRRAIPQMADTEQVYRRLRRRSGVRYPVLVPNERGLDAALACGVEDIAVFTAASETFNRKYIRAGIAVSLQRFEPVVRRARDAGLGVRGYVSTGFGCPPTSARVPIHAVSAVIGIRFHRPPMLRMSCS